MVVDTIPFIDVDIDTNVTRYFEDFSLFVGNRRKNGEFSNYINDRSFLLSTFFPAFVQLHADIAFNEDPFRWKFFNCTLKAFSLIGFMRFAHIKKHI